MFAKKYGLPVTEVVIPRFVDHKNPHVAGKPVVVRKNILGIVWNPFQKKYLGLKWKEQPWTTFVVGGIDGDESPEVAARREITEETGYKNLKFKKVISGPIQTEYYAAHKEVNRVSHSWHVLFELENEEKNEVSVEEKNIHEVVWLDPKGINSQSITHVEIDFVMDRMNGKTQIHTGDGVLTNSAEFDGQNASDALKAIVKKAKGKMVVKYKLRDWVFSRQRYWGEPIPLVHCAKCGVVPLPEKELPLKLPNVKSYEPTGTGESPLAAISSWVNTKCPKCKGPAKRETNTMPQWAGSCWYYLRYIDPKNKSKLIDPKKEKAWQPVDMYVGGAEHATRHLIYARFWHKFLHDIGVVSTKEPFMQLKNQGLIAAEDGRKMSKRYGNVVNPDDIVKLYGADTLRVYEMFMGPFDQGIAWSTDNMIGSRRFLERVWRLHEKVALETEKYIDPKSILVTLHKTIKKVTEDIESFSLNTAVSSLMILLNTLEKQERVSHETYKTLITLIAPFAPHMADEIWSNLPAATKKGQVQSVYLAPWPTYNKKYLVDDEVNIVVQINGKVRANILMGAEEAKIEGGVLKKALGLPEIQSRIGDKSPDRVIFVPCKIINLVFKSFQA
jgi:leucyl-tRNA synthetase